MDGSWVAGPVYLFGELDDDRFNVDLTSGWGLGAIITIEGGDNNFAGGLGAGTWSEFGIWQGLSGRPRSNTRAGVHWEVRSG